MNFYNLLFLRITKINEILKILSKHINSCMPLQETPEDMKFTSQAKIFSFMSMAH